MRWLAIPAALVVLASQPAHGDAKHEQQFTAVEKRAADQYGKPCEEIPAALAFDLPRSDDGEDKPGQHDGGSHRDRSTDAEWAMVRLTAVLVGVNVLYLVAAIFQWYAIRRQAEIAKDQATIARNALVLTHRPKLTVRNVVLAYPRSTTSPTPPEWFWPGELVQGQFYIANVGGTSARITDCGCWVHRQRGIFRGGGPLAGAATTAHAFVREVRTRRGRWEISLPMKRPYEGKPGNVGAYGGFIQPGASIPLPFQSDWLMGEEGGHIRFGAEGWSLWVLGFIFYEDESEPPIRRMTAFSREWAPHYGRFVAVDDPDY